MPDQDPIELKDAQFYSRRRVLRAAAWSVPVIAVAAAAPFAAASGGDIVIFYNNVTFNKIWAPSANNWGGVVGNLMIARNGLGTGNLTQLTVQLTFESRLGLTGVPGDVDLTGSASGWSVLSVSVGATDTVYFLSFVGSVAQYGNTGILSFSIPTTISATMAQIGSFSASAYADSSQVVSSISSSTTVS